LQGKLQAVVHWITKQEKGRILLLDDIDAKTGYTNMELLQSKHPDAQHMPDACDLKVYGNTPDFIELDITEEVIKQVARCLSGSAGLGDMDSSAL
jgi:hypothetical protein